MPNSKIGCNRPDTADEELVKKVLEERNLHLLSEIDTDNSETKNVFAKMKRLKNLIIAFNRQINGKKYDDEMRQLFESAKKSKHTIDHQALDDLASYFPRGGCMKRSYLEDFMQGCKNVFGHEENRLYRKIVSNKNYRERTLMKIYYFAKHLFPEIIRKLRTSDDVQVGGVQSVDEQYMEAHSEILQVMKRGIVEPIRFIIELFGHSYRLDGPFTIVFLGILMTLTIVSVIGSALLLIAFQLPYAIAYDVFHIPIYIHNMVVYLRKWNANRREMDRIEMNPLSNLPPVSAEIHLPEHTVIDPHTAPLIREDVHATISDAFHKLKKNAYTLKNGIYKQATDKQINQFLQTRSPALFKREYSRVNRYHMPIPNAINAKPPRDSGSENVGAILATPLEYEYVSIKPNDWHLPVHMTMLSYSIDDEMPEAIETLFENSFVMKNGYVYPADDTDIQHFVSNKKKLYTKINGKIYPLPYEVIEYHKYFAKHDNDYSPATNNDIEKFIYGNGQLYKGPTETYYPIKKERYTKITIIDKEYILPMERVRERLGYHDYFAKHDNDYRDATGHDIENFVYGDGQLYKRKTETYYPIHNPFSKNKSSTIKRNVTIKKRLSPIKESPSPSPKPFWKRRTQKVVPEGAHSTSSRKKGSVVPLGGKRTIRRKRRV